VISNLDITFNAALRARAKVILDEYKDLLGEGSCQDFADYRHLVGICTGINRVLDEAEALRKELTGAR
jgi:hypothetical protein